MNVNNKALIQSVLLGAVGCFLITWMNESGNLKTWSDLTTFGFITKVVGNFVVLTGMNTYFSHKTFRSPDSRTRGTDDDMTKVMLGLSLNKKEEK